MTRDEVYAMPDGELRIKAAEIMGWTDIRIIGLNKTPHGRPPGRDEGTEWVVPCWQRYIAMAWTLVEKAKEFGFSAEISSFRSGVRDMAQCVFKRSDVDWVAEDTSFEKASPARAITRAFIMAMTEED